jgi:hypothetical protein
MTLSNYNDSFGDREYSFAIWMANEGWRKVMKDLLSVWIDFDHMSTAPSWPGATNISPTNQL